jgi:acyl dehydratase
VNRRYLDDFQPGDRIPSEGEYEMTLERIRDYATEYDPQPIHLDAAAAVQEMFGGIVASGWHSLSVTMQLIVEARPFGGSPIVGVAIENLRFLRPVRTGDVLRAEAEVLSVRRSASRPEQGFLVLRVVTVRQGDEPVLTQDWTLLVPRRPQ